MDVPDCGGSLHLEGSSFIPGEDTTSCNPDILQLPDATRHALFDKDGMENLRAELFADESDNAASFLGQKDVIDFIDKLIGSKDNRDLRESMGVGRDVETECKRV